MQAMRRILVLVGAAVAVVGCSASPYLPEQKFVVAAEKRLVRMAGSRIPQMVDLNDPIPAARSPLTIITRDQIDANGASNVAELLGNFSFDYSGAGGR